MFSERGGIKTIKKQEELINQYQEEHEILIKEINTLKEEKEKLKIDLYLANKRKVEYRNQLVNMGIKIKSALSVGKHARAL